MWFHKAPSTNKPDQKSTRSHFRNSSWQNSSLWPRKKKERKKEMGGGEGGMDKGVHVRAHRRSAISFRWEAEQVWDPSSAARDTWHLQLGIKEQTCATYTSVPPCWHQGSITKKPRTRSEQAVENSVIITCVWTCKHAAGVFSRGAKNRPQTRKLKPLFLATHPVNTRLEREGREAGYRRRANLGTGIVKGEQAPSSADGIG